MVLTHQNLILLVLFAAFSLSASPAAAVSIDWVTVGDPGNSADRTGYGAVPYSYRVSKYETTNLEYAEFLNAVDPTGANALGLYDPSMTSHFQGGILYDPGSPVGSRYDPKSGFDVKPVSFVNFYDALRFANWLHNGQGGGSTETGSYTITPEGIAANSITRNAGATIVLTNEDEWYKAAYYDAVSTSYFDYPAGMDAQTLCDGPGPAANTANCDGGVLGPLVDRGLYPGSPSPAGTYDQGGNVWEWNESIVTGVHRGVRGGDVYGGASNLAASFRDYTDPAPGYDNVGFRLARVPEPATSLLWMAGILGLAYRQRR